MPPNAKQNIIKNRGTEVGPLRNTASNPSSKQNVGLGTNKNTLFHTRAVTQTRAEKNVLEPLQKFHSPSPKGKM